METLAKLLSVKEIAEVLGIAEITVRKLCSARKIPFKKIGSRVLFDPREISNFLEKHSVQPLNSSRR